MCGIFGIVSRDGLVSREVLARAKKTLAHRGPDDSGSVVIDRRVPGGQVGFAHTRLSIIDLSPLGHQPMEDPATGNWIVYNGEIYNFRALREELQAAGNKFRSQSDTEVILAAYRTWGDLFVERLRGMFAFALWDASREKLLLARDPLGIKPIYYYQDDRTFLFSSEVRTLLQTGIVPRKIDPNGVLSFLAFGSVYEPRTIVEGVLSVPAGHIVTLKKDNVKSREYWTPLSHTSRKSGPGDVHAPTPNMLKTIREAVISHLVSDVPVGVFLSGGIDSSSLVAVMHSAGVRASTFSLVFREEEFNEAAHSREIATRFGTDHHEILVSQDDTLEVLTEALAAMDQPTIDGINTYLVSAKTRDAGVKVALTGLGADEMFAGYSNFRRVPKMERFASAFGKLPALAQRPVAGMAALLSRFSDRNRKLAELAGNLNVHPYFLTRGLFTPAEREALFAGEYGSAELDLERGLQQSVTASAALDPVNRVSYLESRWYMQNTLLRDSDFMGMAHGLELRVPFLDRALVEACFRIPGKEKLRESSPKALLLASLGVKLPDSIVKRPKRGFTLPFERWLRGEMKSTIESMLLGSDRVETGLKSDAVRQTWARFLAGETSWSRPWALFVLKRWCEVNFEPAA
jgi:asparagine synthase (glutamine-hydrolysing)